MSPRKTTRLAVGAIVLSALAACGSQSPGGSSPTTPGTTTAATPGATSTALDPVGLVGLWRVEDASGVPAGEHAVLRLAPDELSLWRDCGVSFGGWRAAAGLALFDPGRSASGSCSAPANGSADPSSSWLGAATRYERDGGGWRLLDASGRLVARLLPGATLTPRPDIAASLAEPPVLDARARAALAEPTPLPAGLAPATRATTLGRWQLAEPPSTLSRGGKPPFLSVATDGSWTGWDGCNGSSGRWLVGDGGRLLVTSGATTLIGCEGFDLPGVWASAARVGLDHGLLVLVDRDGRQLVRLKGPDVVAH